MRTVVLAMGVAWFVAAAHAQRLEGIPAELANIAQALAEDAAASTDAFWQEIGQEGTPLTEPLEPGGRHYRVTFVFRGDDDTEAVLLAGSISEFLLDYDALYRLGDSDIWFASYRIRSDARVTYLFNVYDEPLMSVTPGGSRPRPRPKRDPHNAQRAGSGNLLELPEAPPDTWHIERNDTAKGAVHDHHGFKSSRLGNERDISVYTPPGYEGSSEPYPWILFFDRMACLREMNVPVILDNGIDAGRIPPVVAVFTGNADGKRLEELGANADFADFVAHELVPWLRDAYNISAPPEDAIISGSSFGGLASAYIAMRHPEIFRNVYTQAGSYWWGPGLEWAAAKHEAEGEFLAQYLMQRDVPPLRFFIEVGLYDGGYTRSVIANRHFRDIAKLRGHTIVGYIENAGGHDYRLWRTSLIDGLSALLEDAPE